MDNAAVERIVELRDVEEAHARIGGFVHRTETSASRTFGRSSRVNAPT